MRTISWVLLMIVAVLILIGSLASATLAYRGGEDQIGPITLEQLTAGQPEVAAALRARRGTAAAFAAAYAVLLLFVVLVPYRRGDKWSWWAILAAALTAGVLILLRIPFLDITLGSAAGALQLGVVLIALLLDFKRLRT